MQTERYSLLKMKHLIQKMVNYGDNVSVKAEADVYYKFLDGVMVASITLTN